MKFTCCHGSKVMEMFRGIILSTSELKRLARISEIHAVELHSLGEVDEAKKEATRSRKLYRLSRLKGLLVVATEKGFCFIRFR